MKTVVLQSLILSNFKGIREFGLITDGNSVKVFGDNAAGKTSLFDGFNWLLFDKDSQNKKDFQLKTVGEDGKELHGLDHIVEGIFKVDGEFLTLKKVFKESWTKKRGQATATFSGHKTEYFINGVPAKKGEYTSKVAELVEEELFKLLTSPSYFNEQLHWQKRRELLLEICGDISDEEVIYASDKDLNALIGILNQRTIEEHKKLIAHKRSEINKKLEFIPARIDEVRRGMADTRELDAEVIQKQIAGEQERIMEAKDELYRIQNGGAVQEKKQQLQEIDWKLREGQQKFQEKLYAATAGIRERLEQNNQDRLQKNGVVNRLKMQITDKENGYKKLAAEVKNLLNDWQTANKKTFDQHATTCPTCSQDLPQEQIEKAIEKFNLNKSNLLERIATEGKEKANRRDELAEEIEKMKYELEQEELKKHELSEAAASIQKEIEEAKQGQQDYTSTQEYTELKQQQANLQVEIQQLQQNTNAATEEIRQRINQMEYTIDTLKGELNKFVQNHQAKMRITELEQEEKELAAMFEKIEQELFLIEEFTRSKVNLLEDKINSKFQHARFKLFEEQINGGLVDTCKTLYKGVPYSEGLNNGARINVGLDIIQTLSQHFNISVPIFVDNAEAVTQMIPIENQVVSLIVSEGDKELRVV